MWILAEFGEKEPVRRAIDALRASGYTPDDIDLFSEEPVELPRGVLDRPSRMSLAAVVGAITFGTLATAGVAWAQNNYRVITGGMPVFSLWGSGVITYETTMMGAVFTTFGFFLWESGLIRKRDTSAPVPAVAPESIVLRLRCDCDKAARSIDLLRRAGAIGIDRRGESCAPRG